MDDLLDIREMDQEMGQKTTKSKKKVLLDSRQLFSASIRYTTYIYIEFIFLHPNVMNIIQLCDQGINQLKALKAHYRKAIINRQD